MRLALSSLSLVCFLALPSAASAQIPDQIKDRAQAKREKAINCVVGDDDCVQDAKKSGKKVVMTDEDGKPVKQAESKAATPAPVEESNADPGATARANFDFVPGERVLFAEDFTTRESMAVRGPKPYLREMSALRSGV